MATFSSDVFGNDQIPVRGGNDKTAQLQPVQCVSNDSAPKQPFRYYSYENGQVRRKHNRPVLPSGTFRGDYWKTIELSCSGDTVSFTFRIEWGYWDDEDGSYRIYMTDFPNMDEYEGECSHEAHLFWDDDYEENYVCWDECVYDFQDANAIAFVWAKKYIRNCMDSYSGRKHVSLPSGTFRSVLESSCDVRR